MSKKAKGKQAKNGYKKEAIKVKSKNSCEKYIY